ncbi:cytochrome c oxidase subunit II [Ammoniphilus sp. CFH 90114]|uniref:cytochrome c oxidase subunit II n=1 Tax=Ammoniphilus sp. CFH 90114 TaxID=2493665 RepID=UPI00100F1883|nr:cytochrome c oxidase subunit II [Ammoniphilus sp. CFH 90114]RXT05654.1 cytochrome c oxidase subunit II [Ammoniphilus sp. CFH 90114]
MSRWNLSWRLLPLLAVMMLVLTGCAQDPYLSALDPKGPVASAQLSLIMLSLYIMIGVFVVVMVIYVYVLFRFRKRPGQTGIPEQVEGNHKLEIIWTVIPLILLAVLAVPTVSLTFDLAEKHSTEEALQVKVTAHQFWWEFEYPDLEISAGQDLYIPTGQKIQFQVTAKDVMHAIWIPALGGKIDTNPGMTNNMWLQADKPGTYKGKCAELCGPSHALMDFKVIALEPAEFDKWVNNMKATATKTVPASAQAGQEVFNQSCIGCHAVDATKGVKVPDIAPNLAGFADRTVLAGFIEHNNENLAQWIKNPQSLKPGNLMPAFEGKLDEQQINDLVEYMNTLTLE